MQFIRHYERYHEYTDLDSKAICRSFGTPGGRMFAVKCELKFNEYRVIIFLSVISITVMAFILRIWELPYEDNILNSGTEGSRNNLQDYGSAIWLTVITMTTVGYGDIYPHTVGGQATAIFIAIWGTFIISLLIMITGQVFDFSPQENGAVLTIIKQRAAARSILHALKFYRAKKAFYIEKLEQDINYDTKSTFIKMLKYHADIIDRGEAPDTKYWNSVKKDGYQNLLIDVVRRHVIHKYKLAKELEEEGKGETLMTIEIK